MSLIFRKVKGGKITIMIIIVIIFITRFKCGDEVCKGARRYPSSRVQLIEWRTACIKGVTEEQCLDIYMSFQSTFPIPTAPQIVYPQLYVWASIQESA